MKKSQTYKCQQCKKQYGISLIVPPDVWETIKPKEKQGETGLLCGSCIMENLETSGKDGVLYITYGNLGVNPGKQNALSRGISNRDLTKAPFRR